MRPASFITALAVAVTLQTPARAMDLVVLAADGAEKGRFTQEDVERVDLRTIRTTTPWTDGIVEFSGADMRALLAAADAADVDVTALAADDYAAEISLEDLARHTPLIATRMNGERLTLGNKGPFWIVFDFDDADADHAAQMRTKAVWHLIELELH